MNNSKNIDGEEMKGKVWLAGAGPGDAGLLTIRTAELMEEADVIVYDALLSAQILSKIPEHTETIFVGKHAGHHPVPQHEINRILVEEAKKGKHVLRLKGGDPFVFGRGGEEVEELLKEDISFEIISGITSSVAVPAYAGIPVTHRDYTSSFHVITGHARKDGKLEIDFQSLVSLNGTLVFLMSVSSMEMILNGLMDAGMDPDTPAAVLERGTTAKQRRIVATVGTLKEEAERSKVKTPAIIMVGQVCELSETFHWAEDRPLGGKQILITRPRQNSSVLSKQLRDLGAQVIELPSIHTVSISPNERLRQALEQFGTISEEEWIVFTSPIGVTVFFEQLKEIGVDLRSIFCKKAIVKFAAIGSGTAAALRSYGLISDVVPEIYNAKELGMSIAEKALKGSHILIVRAQTGSEELLPPLECAELIVEDVPLYRTEYEVRSFLRHKIEKMFEKEEIDCVTFTSASTVEGFVHSFEKLDLTKIHAICIGEQTANKARDYGMDVKISQKATIESLVEEVIQNYGNQVDADGQK